jgi:hypothetical protein
MSCTKERADMTKVVEVEVTYTSTESTTVLGGSGSHFHWLPTSTRPLPLNPVTLPTLRRFPPMFFTRLSSETELFKNR